MDVNALVNDDAVVQHLAIMPQAASRGNAILDSISRSCASSHGCLEPGLSEYQAEQHAIG